MKKSHRARSQEDPKCLLNVPLALPRGAVYKHLAWGPDGFIAGDTEAALSPWLCRAGSDITSIKQINEPLRADPVHLNIECR